MEESEDRFHAFWAHDRESEKLAFEQTIDFIVARLSRYPGAHVYHYASYAQTALKRLAMYHATRERDVDNLLRTDRLVALSKSTEEHTSALPSLIRITYAASCSKKKKEK